LSATKESFAQRYSWVILVPETANFRLPNYKYSAT
jgi:hypothetical protein